MASNQKNAMRVRASLFASPGGPSSEIPRKKRAPGTSIFSDSIIEDVRGAPAPFPRVEDDVVENDDVEPMEVDTTVVPSPVKQLSEQKEQEEKEQEDLETSGHIPCTRATTPRRKSMPTPGKRLCFTSKEVNSDEDDVEKILDEERNDETTQLELLMSNNPDEMPNKVKALIEDNKAMKVYDARVLKEIDAFHNILKNREKLLQNAKLQAEQPLSSRAPTAPLDLFAVKKETTEDVMQKLVGSFLNNVIDAQELSRKKTALAKMEETEKEGENLRSAQLKLEELKEHKRLHDAQMHIAYKKEQARLEELTKKIQEGDELMARLTELKGRL